jgi:hypothetical protein
LMTSAIEIFVDDVNDVEAHVYARYLGDMSSRGDSPSAEPIELLGTLRGPYCETSRTLPAEFVFRRHVEPRAQSSQAEGPIGNAALAEAVVPDPCLWSPELPHVYHANVEARQGGRVVAEYHGQVGLRRTTPRRGGMEFPG